MGDTSTPNNTNSSRTFTLEEAELAAAALFAGQGGVLDAAMSAAGLRAPVGQELNITLLEELDCMPTHLLLEHYARVERERLLNADQDDDGGGYDGFGGGGGSGGGGSGGGGGHSGGNGGGGGTGGGGTLPPSSGTGDDAGNSDLPPYKPGPTHRSTPRSRGTSGVHNACKEPDLDIPSAAASAASIYAAQMGDFMAAEREQPGGLSSRLQAAIGHSQGMAAAISVSATGGSPDAMLYHARCVLMHHCPELLFEF